MLYGNDFSGSKKIGLWRQSPEFSAAYILRVLGEGISCHVEKGSVIMVGVSPSQTPPRDLHSPDIIPLRFFVLQLGIMITS